MLRSPCRPQAGLLHGSVNHGKLEGSCAPTVRPDPLGAFRPIITVLQPGSINEVPLSFAPARTRRFYADRTAGGDRDHRDSRQPFIARGAAGPGGGPSQPVPEQYEAAGPRRPQLRQHLSGVPAGRRRDKQRQPPGQFRDRVQRRVQRRGVERVSPAGPVPGPDGSVEPDQPAAVDPGEHGRSRVAQESALAPDGSPAELPPLSALEQREPHAAVPQRRDPPMPTASAIRTMR